MFYPPLGYIKKKFSLTVPANIFELVKKIAKRENLERKKN